MVHKVSEENETGNTFRERAQERAQDLQKIRAKKRANVTTADTTPSFVPFLCFLPTNPCSVWNDF